MSSTSNSSMPDMTDISPKWIQGIPTSPNEPAWSIYDSVIKDTVRAYDKQLQGQGRYPPLDWLLIKAMCWTETGAGAPEWKTRPAQIGNTGDLGLQELLSRKPQYDLLIPPEYRTNGPKSLTFTSVRTDPVANIRAGVGYLLLGAASFSYQSIQDGDKSLYHHKVVRGDSFGRIGKIERTTIEELGRDNPALVGRSLTLGQDVQFRKASKRWVLISIRPLTPYQAALAYNTRSVDEYTKKMTYCLWILNGGKA